ncbi:MAG: menaquinone biosynthesis protein [Gemmatimonadetes bacterium]|nr:menaquinone biosynthesis protein [Gemmatimonadota bacterium]
MHGPLLLGDVPFDGEVLAGEPSRLNRLLAAGRIQVAPCSSIEYARHAERYRVVPDLAIASRGDVRSILLASRRPPERLGSCVVGLPTASASSSCLAEILLTKRFGAEPEFGWFDQTREDPFERFDAALFIGDVALGERARRAGEMCWTDLGGAWTEWTGLPFVYALWQVHAAPSLDGPIALLARALLDGRSAGLADLPGLAERYPETFPLGRDALPRYWSELGYRLDEEAREGLIAFYTMAVEIGQIDRVPDLAYVEPAGSPIPA